MADVIIISEAGPQGAPGPGAITGGTTGQALVKASNTDYDYTWGSFEPAGSITTHNADTAAHGQTATGRALLTAASAAAARTTLSVPSSADLTAHEADTNNPHGVTAEQIGAQPVDSDLTAYANAADSAARRALSPITSLPDNTTTPPVAGTYLETGGPEGSRKIPATAAGLGAASLGEARALAANSRVFSVAGVPVATRLMFPNQGLYSANAPTITYRSSHVVLRWGNVLRLLWLNQSYNGTASNAFTLTASIQVAAAQGSNLSAVALQRIRFSGQDSVVIPPGGYALSDPIFAKYEPGNVLFVRTCCASAAANNNWPVGMFVNRGNEGTAAGDQTNADVAFTPATTGYAPQLICGPSADGKWVYAAGDSILDGSADPSNNRGFFDLWQLATNTPGSRSSHPGETAGTAAARFVSARILMALGATKALNTYGTNDIGQGADLPTLQASWISGWRDQFIAGLSPYQATILPRATSSDNWITAGNQTPWALDAIRIAANDWLRAGAPCTPSGNSYAPAAIGAPGAIPCPYLGGVVDIAAAVEVNAAGALTQNGGRWFVGASLRTAQATAGTSAASIIDAAANFNGLARSVAGCLVRITAGTGAGQVNWIVGAQSNTQINLLNNFAPAPDATSTYEIIDTPTRDAVHPSANRHYDVAAYLQANFSL